jgi:dipeptidyl aminopeptidase/acylaminoacyl peptidase
VPDLSPPATPSTSPNLSPPATPSIGPTLFHDLDAYIALPRITGLRPSPDGTWLAASVQVLAADRKKFASSIWQVDCAAGAGGAGAARRLTWSAEGEGSPRFLADGSLLFISRRRDPGTSGKNADADATAGLWLLPPNGGEARLIATLPGGITAVEAGSATTGTGGIVVASPVLDATRTDDTGGSSGAGTVEADARLRAARGKDGVSAVLHESGIVRFWDADLGPADTRLFALGEAVPDEAVPDEAAGAQAGSTGPRDLTPDVAHSFIEHTFAVSPDGAQVATNWYQWAGDRYRNDLVLIDVATGAKRVLLSDAEADFDSPSFAPDGQSLVCVRSDHDTPDGPGDHTLLLVDLADGAYRDLLPGFDRWPGGPAWHPAGGIVYFTADDGGRRPVFRVNVVTGDVARVTGDDGHYGELNVSADGAVLYTLRDALDEPPTPVRISTVTGAFERLAAPGQRPAVPGRLTEITALADDGRPIRGWLVLPESTGPAPLVLFVHGGPRSSWNSWQWRWNAWLMAARGYAVLMPDPALSTGYGLDFVKRGYGAWGPRPFADLMAITDAAVARDDIDETRTAMMGGSYGGYMANWIAGHTDRFKAIVSHASLWSMDQMMATTDVSASFSLEFPDADVLLANSPHRHVAAITTPMLVIHGDHDYRVPIGEALRLWWDLQRHGKTAKFLYFPDENHWVLSPGNIKAWYATVHAFLAEHVLGEDWKRPDLL